MSYFEDKKEAFFFSNTIELVEIIYKIKNNPTIRDEIINKAKLKLMESNNSIEDRIDLIIKNFRNDNQF